MCNNREKGHDSCLEALVTFPSVKQVALYVSSLSQDADALLKIPVTMCSLPLMFAPYTSRQNHYLCMHLRKVNREALKIDLEWHQSCASTVVNGGGQQQILKKCTKKVFRKVCCSKTNNAKMYQFTSSLPFLKQSGISDQGKGFIAIIMESIQKFPSYLTVWFHNLSSCQSAK